MPTSSRQDGKQPRRKSSTIHMNFSELSTDLLAGCVSFLAPADVCRTGRASRHARDATTIVLALCTTLSLVAEPPFVTDGGLAHLLRRCPVLTEIDIDARRLSETGATTIAKALPRLESVALHHGYELPGIACLTTGSRNMHINDPGNDHSRDDSSRSTTVVGSGVLEPENAWERRPSPPPPPLALRSLALCSIGQGAVAGASHSDSAEWYRLARDNFTPTLRSLTLTNSSSREFLPLPAISPFFPRPMTGGAASANGEDKTRMHSLERRGEPGAARVVIQGGDATAQPLAEGRCQEEDGGRGLVELSLASVNCGDVTDVLLGNVDNSNFSTGARAVSTALFLEGGHPSAAALPLLLPPLAHLRRLNLVLDHITDVLCDAIANGCLNLEQVYLRQKYAQYPPAFCDAGLFALARCKHLRSLSLRSNCTLTGCSDVGLVYVAMTLGKLEELSLCFTIRASDSSAAAILDHPDRQLRRLCLEGICRLDGHVFIQPPVRTVQSSRRLAVVHSLTSLSLAKCSSVTPEALMALVSACGPCLESLDLSCCFVTDELLEPILTLPGLRDLTLNRCPFTNDGLISACRASTSPMLPHREAHRHRRQDEQQKSQLDCGGDRKKKRVEQSEPEVRLDKRATSAPPQFLRKLSVGWCEGIRGSGIIAVLRSGRLGRHSSALAADGVEGVNDGHVEELVAGLPRLRELKLSFCLGLTSAAVASIVRSDCGRKTLSVLELTRCPGIDEAASHMIGPPALPELVKLGWWGMNAKEQARVAAERGGNCWVVR